MIELRDVTIAYGARKILESLSFNTGTGEFLGIIGQNGSGKTTLLKAISRVIRPSSGTIMLDGREVREFRADELSRTVGVVPQSTDVKFDFSVSDIVMMGRFPHTGRFGQLTPSDYAICRKAMETTATLHLAERSVKTLSGGELQRVVIARALAQQPRLLLLDEPTSHLDIGHQLEILHTLSRMSREIAVIGVFHDLHHAVSFCDRLVLLHDHRVLAMGPPDAVITPVTVRTAFGIDVVISRDPVSGKPVFSPVEKPREGNGPRPRVHVISGGGEGSGVIQALHAAACRVTCGVLCTNDSDYVTTRALGIPAVCEPPFSPVSTRALCELEGMIHGSDRVVLVRSVFGPGNIGNLRALDHVPGDRVIIMDPPGNPEGTWDYSGGEATTIIARLKEKGAVVVPGTRGVVSAVQDGAGGVP